MDLEPVNLEAVDLNLDLDLDLETVDLDLDVETEDVDLDLDLESIPISFACSTVKRKNDLHQVHGKKNFRVSKSGGGDNDNHKDCDDMRDRIR